MKAAPIAGTLAVDAVLTTAQVNIDVIYTVLYYDGGLEEAIRLFKTEAELNLAHPVACQVLRDRFEDKRAKGPAAYASFCLEEQSLMIELNEEERVYRYTALANQAVDVAVALLARKIGSPRIKRRPGSAEANNVTLAHFAECRGSPQGLPRAAKRKIFACNKYRTGRYSIEQGGKTYG